MKCVVHFISSEKEFAKGVRNNKKSKGEMETHQKWLRQDLEERKHQ